MNTTRFYQALMIMGALVTLAILPLALLVAGRVPDLGPKLGDLNSILFFLTGAFAFWRRPEHPAARRLLQSSRIDRTTPTSVMCR